MTRPTPRRHRHPERGFTLVELIVALSAGLLVTASAFMLAKSSMQSFQDESRISTAQVAVSIGMNRLQADLARAGYMASPNAQFPDPKLCPPATITNVPITAVQVREGTTALTGLDATFGYGGGLNPSLAVPDVIVVAGNLTSTEQFEFRGSDGTEMYLALDRGPMVRLLRDLGNDRRAIRNVFVPLRDDDTPAAPRFARVVDQSGKESYIQVTDVDVQPNIGTGTPDSITLTIQSADGGAATNNGTECGFVNRGTGLINPVSIVRYRIGQICNPQDLSTCVSPLEISLAASNPDDEVTGESTRADLIREELTPLAAQTNVFGTYAFDPLATPLTATLASQEIAAEFAVQLDVEATVDTSPAGAPGTTRDIIAFNAGDIDDVTANSPQDFRSFRVRLSTRSRLPDRDVAGQQTVNTAAATRFEIPAVVGRNRFARMRTLETEIRFPNLAAVTW